MKSIQNMSRSDFYSLPHRGWDEYVEFGSMIVLPIRYDIWGVIKYKIKKMLSNFFALKESDLWEVSHLHDSGYRNMDFVAIKDGKPLCLLAGGSDVIHIEGISGYGMDWMKKYSGCPTMVPPTSWSVDCLPASGLLHFFPSTGRMTCGAALSSFEIYLLKRESE